MLQRSGSPASERMKDLPARLGDAGQFAGVRHLAKADSAQAELLVDRMRASATVATGVPAHCELRLALRLHDQSGFRHGQISLNGKPRSFSSARPSSSVVAVVTTGMSIPRGLSMRSISISWNIDCSLRPNV